MEYSESYNVAVVGTESVIEQFFLRLEAAVIEPKNVHLAAGPVVSESLGHDDGLVFSAVLLPDLSPVNTSAAVQLHAVTKMGGNVALKGAKRVLFRLVSSLSVRPHLVVGVVDLAGDAEHINARRLPANSHGVASPKATSKALGPSSLAVLDSAGLAAHDGVPMLVVDLGGTAPIVEGAHTYNHRTELGDTGHEARPPLKPSGATYHHVSTEDLACTLTRRLHILAAGEEVEASGSFVGVVPFSLFEVPLLAQGFISDDEQASPSPSRPVFAAESDATEYTDGDSPRSLIDPAAFLTSCYTALTCPRHIIWDTLNECIRPSFVAHFRRCFWLFDKDRDGLLKHEPEGTRNGSNDSESIIRRSNSAPRGEESAPSGRGELHTAIAAMFGICTSEDVKEVLASLKDAEREMRAELEHNESDDMCQEHGLVVIFDEGGEDVKGGNDGEESPEGKEMSPYLGSLDEAVPSFGVTEAGFIQYLHSLLSLGDHHVRGVWYMLKSFGHDPLSHGNVHSNSDLMALRRARVQAASETLHRLNEIRDDTTVIVDDDDDMPELSTGQSLSSMFLTSKVVQGQLSSAGVAFFSSLFPSGPRVGLSKPSAFPSLSSMWNVIPPSFPLPWAGVKGMPQTDSWLSRSDELLLGKKQGSRSYATYTGKWKLENVFRFLECWEWAASGAVFMPRPDCVAADLTSTWWRQEALVMYARQWGFRGDASKLITFRPLREFREGRPSVDGVPRLIHVCLVGPRESGKTALSRLITYDGCADNNFLVDDDEHDIPTLADEGEGGEEDGAGRDEDESDETHNADDIRITSVTIDATSLSALQIGDDNAVQSPGAVFKRLTTLYFYEIPPTKQAVLFASGLESPSLATNAKPRDERGGVMPTTAAGLWDLMNRPNLLACMDVCLAAFDGTDPLGFSKLIKIWERREDAISSPGLPFESRAKAWTSCLRLPIVLVLTKADELPVGQLLEERDMQGALGSRRSNSRLRSRSSRISAESQAADVVSQYCTVNGLMWPPVITSAMSELLHPQFANQPSSLASSSAVTNAADGLNALVAQLALSPAALVGPRVSRKDRDAEVAIERAAVMTRRLIVVGAAIGVAALIGKVISKVFGRRRRN